MPDSIVFYPRAVVALAGVVKGEDFSSNAAPASVSITENPVTHASTAQVQLHGSSLPFRGHQAQALTLAIYLGNVGSNDPDVGPIDRNNPKKNLRFIGNVDRRRREEGSRGQHVTLECRDLSGPLRDEKPINPAAIPSYNDTAREALQRVIDSVPGLSAQLSLRDTPALDAPLRRAVGKRAVNGHVALPKTTTTAWDVCGIIADCVGALLRVELDELVLEQPSDVFGEAGSPSEIPVSVTLAMGGDQGNLLEVTEEQKYLSNRRGFLIKSYDPVARLPLEVKVPEDAALPARRLPKSVTGKVTKSRKPAKAPEPQREIVTAYGLHTVVAMKAYGQRLYQERALGEVTVEATTPIITDAMLSLHSGDLVVLRMHPDIVADFKAQPTEQRKVDFLVQRMGIAPEAARILTKATDAPNGYFFRIKSAGKQWHATGQSTRVHVELYSIFVEED